MVNRSFLAIFLLVTAVAAGVDERTRDLPTILKDACSRSDDVPGAAAAVVWGGEIEPIAVYGLQQSGADRGVQPDDAFHIGSCTKAFTSTLVGVLVDEGRMTWETTVVAAIPDLRGGILPVYEAVTIDQLLSHRAGVMAFTRPGGKENEMTHGLAGSNTEQRREFVERLLNVEPLAAPGLRYEYSNAGYSVVAAMLESITGESWQELVRTRIFQPLNMSSSGFGMPATPEHPDRVWGHFSGASGLIQLPPMPEGVLPPVLEPAGDIHASAKDMAKFLCAHLAALTHSPPAADEPDGQAINEVGNDATAPPSTPRPFLSHETAKRLHAPLLNDYALGWFTFECGGARATAHNGSAGFFFALMAIWPELDLAAVVLTNSGAGEGACLEVLEAIGRQHASGSDLPQ
jgi:CubicO group peptidase (beta-lactamase class C family)